MTFKILMNFLQYLPPDKEPQYEKNARALKKLILNLRAGALMKSIAMTGIYFIIFTDKPTLKEVKIHI